MMRKLSPIHPGEILQEEFLVPLKLSATAFAKHINVPPNRITRLIAGQTSITGDTALRLSRAFGTSPELWMNLQTHYDLQVAEDKQSQLDNIKPVIAA